MENRPSLSERITRFLNPPTEVELQNRREQIKNAITFTVVTGLIVYFRKGLETNLAKIAEAS